MIHVTNSFVLRCFLDWLFAFGFAFALDALAFAFPAAWAFAFAEAPLALPAAFALGNGLVGWKVDAEPFS